MAILRIFRIRALDERGATAIEYGLIVALIAVAVLQALAALGGGAGGMWGELGNIANQYL